jgi:DoxX-like family
MTLSLEKISHWALALLWLSTGITSIWGAPEIGYEVLARGHIVGDLAAASLYLGSALDIFLGLWILTGYRLWWCGWVQILTIITYTVLLTLIAAEFWLHPFGPLTKNLPIVILIYVVFINKTRLLK